MFACGAQFLLLLNLVRHSNASLSEGKREFHRVWTIDLPRFWPTRSVALTNHTVSRLPRPPAWRDGFVRVYSPRRAMNGRGMEFYSRRDFGRMLIALPLAVQYERSIAPVYEINGARIGVETFSFHDLP
jgi:hypothetical protein